MDINDAVIIAGGKGSRLQQDLPKALVNVKGRPIISYQLDYLLGSGRVDRVILALGYKADEVKKYVNSAYPDSPIYFSTELEPLGTGGALKNALKKSLTDYVLALNCDDITDIKLSRLTKLKENTICVAHPRLPFGRVVEKDGYAFFEEKPMLEDWVSCGWYFFDKASLLRFLPDKGSLEYDVFPNIKLKLYKHEGFWRTVNTDKELLEFESADLPAALIKG
jgi:NDP-sugar pyrophosphorylase family protein